MKTPPAAAPEYAGLAAAPEYGVPWVTAIYDVLLSENTPLRRRRKDISFKKLRLLLSTSIPAFGAIPVEA